VRLVEYRIVSFRSASSRVGVWSLKFLSLLMNSVTILSATLMVFPVNPYVPGFRVIAFWVLLCLNRTLVFLRPLSLSSLKGIFILGSDLVLSFFIIKILPFDTSKIPTLVKKAKKELSTRFKSLHPSHNYKVDSEKNWPFFIATPRIHRVYPLERHFKSLHIIPLIYTKFHTIRNAILKKDTKKIPFRYQILGAI